MRIPGPNKEFIRGELRYELYFRAFDKQTADRAMWMDDPEVKKAIESLPKAQALVQQVQKVMAQREAPRGLMRWLTAGGLAVPLAGAAAQYEIYAIRYATIPDFQVSQLVAGADRGTQARHRHDGVAGARAGPQHPGGFGLLSRPVFQAVACDGFREAVGSHRAARV